MDLICSSRGGPETCLDYRRSTQDGASGGTSASAGLSFAGGGGGKAMICLLQQEQRIKDPQNFALSPWRYMHVLGTKLGFFLVFMQKENKYIFLSVVGSSMLRVCRSLPCSIQHLHRNSFLLQFYFCHACSRAGVSGCCSCFLIYRNIYLWHLAVSLKAACLPKNISPNDCCRK